MERDSDNDIEADAWIGGRADEHMNIAQRRWYFGIYV